MSIRLEAKNNYIVLTDTVSGDTIEYPKSRLRYKDFGNTIQFKYIDDSSQDRSYQFSELVDKDGLAWSSLNALITWLQLNTSITSSINTSPLMIVEASNLITETTLASATSKDDLTITVTDATGFLAGQYLTIYNADDNRVFFSYILSVSVNDVTLDTPLDFEFSIGSFVSVGNSNMAVNGSVTPVVFGIRNPTGTDIPLSYDVTRLMFKCLTNGTVDLSKFGDIAGGITRGLVARKIDGTYRNIFNVKTNGDFKNLMYDIDIQLASGNQQDGFTGRFTFARLGSVLRLEKDEDLQFIVQDDLSTLDSFKIIAEGSEVKV